MSYNRARLLKLTFYDWPLLSLCLCYLKIQSPIYVLFQEKDAYGNEVGVSARRVPVAYLLVDVPCGVANEGRAPTFHPPAQPNPPGAFPPAHRALHQHMQTLQALHQHIESSPTFLDVSILFIRFKYTGCKKTTTENELGGGGGGCYQTMILKIFSEKKLKKYVDLSTSFSFLIHIVQHNKTTIT